MAGLIDHTVLKANAADKDIKQLCEDAKKFEFCSVCVNPSKIEQCKSLLDSTDVKICTVVGFPLGANTSESKAFETANAEKLGADEIDMVINVGRLKDNDLEFVYNDISAVVNSTSDKVLTKVIIECCYLTEDEKIKACLICKAAGADFVKTSTGFGTGGATIDDVELMREVVGDDLGVKAAGGIKDANDSAAMVKAGASRIGASASISIVSGMLRISGPNCGPAGK